jgi:hypothetical protein
MGSADGRKIKLSGIKFYQKIYKGAYVTVRGGTYTGMISVPGSELIGDVSERRSASRKPVALALYDSKIIEGNIVCVPVTTADEDDLALEWTGKGRKATADVGRLLAFKGIQVPEGSRWICEFYVESDPDMGEVIGLKVVGAQFVPLRVGKARKAQSA